MTSRHHPAIPHLQKLRNNPYILFSWLICPVCALIAISMSLCSCLLFADSCFSRTFRVPGPGIYQAAEIFPLKGFGIPQNPLQQRRQKAAGLFLYTHPHIPLRILFLGDFPAVGQVIHKGLLQLACDFLVINGGIDLKVQFKTSYVHVGCSIAAHPSVYHDALGVEEAVFIHIDPGPIVQKLPCIGAGSPVHKGMVRLAGNHQPHIHP